MCLKMSLCFSLLLVFLCITDISSYKVLGIFPFAAPSHYSLGNELMKGLAEAGHDATILTVFEEKNPPKNGKYRQIIMKEAHDEQQAMFRSMGDFKNKASGGIFNNPLKMLTMFNMIGSRISQLVFDDTKTKELLKSNQKFDIVIVPQFSVEATKALAPHFDAHLVLFNPVAASSWMNRFVGNPSLPSLNPEIVLGYIGQMNFQQRLFNTLFTIASYFNYNLMQYPTQAELVRKYISKDMDLNKILYNVSLVLSNSHSSLNPAAGSVPCMKEIAGFHVKPPKKLPGDLQKYLDGAKNGVIYFSMGSNLKSANLPIETREALMSAFSKRKENILWKFEDESMPGKPGNVKIEKWLPQSDLLAHPNIKLFITHGGFLSTIETVYHGVPTVAIPILGDQMQNAKQAESIGFTKVLDFANLTEESISAAIEEVLTNKKYRDNVKARSKIFHDRQIKPMDEAIYWIEYIVRHNGARHLRVGYLDLAWHQYYLLDVFGLIFAIIFAVGFIIKKTTCWIVRKIFKSKGSPGIKSPKKVKKH